MASAVPVVALDLPGVRDLMTDGQEGLIVRDAADLPAAVRRLIESPETRGGMARQARSRALEFTGEKFVEKAKEFYDGLSFPSPSGRGSG
jgi:glycosyltransferase involved in cell wall biosynthesis